MEEISTKKLWDLVVLSLVIAIVLVIISDFNRLLIAFNQFNWWLVLVAILLTLLSIVVRFFKWEYLIRKTNIKIPMASSFIIFWSALVMIISPGKIGEIWKSWQLRDRHEIKIADSLPVVIVERAADLIGVLVLGCIGAYAISRSVLLLITTLGTIIILIIAIRNQPTCEKILGFLHHVPYVNKKIPKIRQNASQAPGLIFNSCTDRIYHSQFTCLSYSNY